MKRVLLCDENSRVDYYPSEPLVRRAAVALLDWATRGADGVRGDDERYIEVVEDRQRQFNRWKASALERARTKGEPPPHIGVYSSCGDIVNWLLLRLGVRSDYINRAEGPDGWEMSLNVSDFERAPEFVSVTAGTLLVPEPGDVLRFGSQGSGHDLAHIFAVRERSEHEKHSILYCSDYGQAHDERSICGKRTSKKLWKAPDGWRAVGYSTSATTHGLGKIVHKWLPLWAAIQGASKRRELVEALVPDDFEGGVEL
jgi:hypothetical protein